MRPGSEDAPTPAGLLGDIVLCPAVAETQAVAAKHSTQDELILLTTHGLLHLLGFDHAEPDEEREMFRVAARADRRLPGRRTPASGMTEALLLVAALLLVRLRRVDAASEAALGVTSRTDLLELGPSGRKRPRALRRIADDTSAHLTAVVFIRVLAETTAAVLVAASFMLIFDDIWLAVAPPRCS